MTRARFLPVWAAPWPSEFWGLLGMTAALTAVRLLAATRVGFGDSEALYASYALHPMPAYLDHPGFVGVLARAFGGGTAPTPFEAHIATSLLAAVAPWIAVLSCRAAGAPMGRSLGAGIVMAAAPEVAIGLFALTPDLPLMLVWTGSLALAAHGLRSPPGGLRSFLAFTAAGLLAGVATVSKASGVLLGLSLAAVYAHRAARAHGRTAGPWIGLATGAVLAWPVLSFEAQGHWPLLRHRLVDTQSGAGLSLRNGGALLGGQLLYLSPIVAVLAVKAVGAAFRARNADAVGALLWIAFAAPAAVLVPLCLWSPVAEPHWIAPALLALMPAAARTTSPPSRRLVVQATALAAVLSALVYAWVLVPSAVRLAPGTYDARVDISNELFGWPEVLRAVREETESARAEIEPWGRDTVVVGPHWVVCAQLESGLRGALPVGCATSVEDDFDQWLPRFIWRQADTIVWVTDARFGRPPPLPSYATARSREIQIRRDGRVVRTFTIAVLKRLAQASRELRPVVPATPRRAEAPDHRPPRGSES